MQINEGKFLQNGRCGYVLKPEFMLKSDYNPYYGINSPPADEEPLILTIRVCDALNLTYCTA